MIASRAVVAVAALLVASPVPSLAQPAQGQGPAPRTGASTRPGTGTAGPGLAPLQTEPGDVWAEVRSWSERGGRAEPPRRRTPPKSGGGAPAR